MDVRYDRHKEKTSSLSSSAPTSEYLETYPKLGEALQACNLRFIINLPEESLRSAPRICFELQEAHWFYLDYLYENSRKQLPKLNMVTFFNLMLDTCDLLKAIYATPKQQRQLMDDWREYNKKVPSKGVILLNDQLTKCLMVQPWKGEKWTFPRGKINEGETEVECAKREAWEETGINVDGRVDPTAFVEADVHGTGNAVRMFMIPDIAETIPCRPNVRKEISKIGWVRLDRLPGWDPSVKETPLRFFAVEDFVPHIRQWVERRRQQGRERQQGGELLQRVKRQANEKALFSLNVEKIMEAFDHGWAHGSWNGYSDQAQ